MKLRYNHYLCLLLGAMAIASCSDDTSDALSWEIGDGTKIDYPEDYFTGGQLGTTTNNSSTAYKQPSLAVENAGMVTAFNEGEYLSRKTSIPTPRVPSTAWARCTCALDATTATQATDMVRARMPIRPRRSAMATSSSSTTSRPTPTSARWLVCPRPRP